MCNRRAFLHCSGGAATGLLASTGQDKEARKQRAVTIFLCGDVMTGRGIDQVLPYSCDPRLHESYVESAREYVQLAERVNGSIPAPVSFSYIWGDALKEFEEMAPDVRIINLETAVTTSDDWAAKGINYRMHPRNVECLTAAGIDCCVLANNHVLDWGCSGLSETLGTLHGAGLKIAGAGENRVAAEAPAVLRTNGPARVLVFACGLPDSGIPDSWGATRQRPGIALLQELSETEAEAIARRVRAVKQARDIAIVSIHWGGNWGYEVPAEQQAFARMLIERADVDVVHGHSSHHPKGIEVYKGRPILYGCGDFLNDYEGIRGYEQYRSHLVLMYFATIDPERRELVRFAMRPLEIRRFRLQRASATQAQWLRAALDRESKKSGARVARREDNTLTLGWR
jgi:poly-gamma-glutamate synthesis protein (capsule biosynthesis protein)